MSPYRFETGALFLVSLSTSRRFLIDRILSPHRDRINSREIADHLNAPGITSKTGKAFYPALVYSVNGGARQ